MCEVILAFSFIFTWVGFSCTSAKSYFLLTISSFKSGLASALVFPYFVNAGTIVLTPIIYAVVNINFTSDPRESWGTLASEKNLWTLDQTYNHQVVLTESDQLRALDIWHHWRMDCHSRHQWLQYRSSHKILEHTCIQNLCLAVIYTKPHFGKDQCNINHIWTV